MALIDEIAFHAKAGNGGAGVVRWRHEKGKEFAGAAGGNAGPGGDVYVKAVRDINILARHKATKQFSAENGEDGKNWSKHGAAGRDCIIELPIGSVVKNLASGRTIELLEEGQTTKILHGGRGGLGNEHFKASTNVRPEQSTSGYPGEEADFVVELNLIADAGLIGLPNAGKSSLLNALTNANAKVASYAFTTLDPNLGALPGGYILADIPGLIEGASDGKGLGIKFLKHVRRTKLLVHLVSVENMKDGEKMEKVDVGRLEEAYLTVRRELDQFDHALTEKREVIIVSKTDEASPEDVRRAKEVLGKYSKDIYDVSIFDEASIKELGERLGRLLVM